MQDNRRDLHVRPSTKQASAHVSTNIRIILSINLEYIYITSLDDFDSPQELWVITFWLAFSNN
jgi:hypothetical protein